MGKLTDFQKIEMVEKYLSGNYNCQRLGEFYGVSRVSIANMLKIRGVFVQKINRKSKFTINQRYFEKIDTEHKAYFLGLLYADGCNSINSFSLSLISTDRHIIDEFNHSLESNRIPYIRMPKIYKGSKYGQSQEMCRLTIYNQKMCKDLVKLGCGNKKSLTLKFPNNEQVPDHLISHFVRGYFDGDGSISSYWSNYDKAIKVNCEISSNIDFNSKLKEILYEKLHINCGLKPDKRCTSLFRQLRIHGNRQIKKFLDWIYKESTVYLERKHSRYKELFNYSL